MEMSKTRPDRGDIYWIDQNEYKQQGKFTMNAGRPAVIVSSREAHGNGITYEVVFLTTNPRFDAATHCTIRSSKKVSTALCEQVTTISREQIGAHLGTCSPEEMATIETCIMISLGLDDRYYQDDREDPYEMTEEEDVTEGIDAYNEALINMLRSEAAEAKAEASLMRSLYDEILEKALNR